MNTATVRLLGQVGASLVASGESVEQDGDALYATVQGHRIGVASGRTSRIVVYAIRAWDGHQHSPLPAHVERSWALSRADWVTIASMIRERLHAFRAALAACVHRPSADGICPECGCRLPVAPPGTATALRTAEAEMVRRGRRGSFAVSARGDGLRLTWHPSWVDFPYETTERSEAALAVAVEHLRAGGLSADVVIGAGWAVLSPVPSADERTCLDAVRDDGPLDAAAE